MKPKLSVCLITYNHEKYLQQCIESIIAQKCNEPFEIIIGEDNLAQFKNWKNHKAILDYYGLYVYPRPNV